MILIPGLLDISDSDSNFDSSQKWNHSRTRIVHLPHKLYKWSNLMLMWAHLPVQYTVIGVSGKWLVIPCKCTTRYTVAKFQVASYYFLNYELLSGMNYYPVWFLVKSTQTDGQTDRKWRIWAHRAKCTGGLKKNVYRLLNYWPPNYCTFTLSKIQIIFNSFTH